MDHLDGYPTDALTIDGMSTVDGMSTASTTHSLVRQMNSVSVDPAIMQRVAKQHNDNSAETIMSGTTGQLIPIPLPEMTTTIRILVERQSKSNHGGGATALVSGLTIKFSAPFQGDNRMVVDMS